LASASESDSRSPVKVIAAFLPVAPKALKVFG